MNRFYLYRLVAIIALFIGFCDSATAQTTTINYTGSEVTYTVPAGTVALYIDARGAKGGAGYSPGGAGGRVVCTLAVTGGQVLRFRVGGAGGNGVWYTAAAGGYNGGGSNTYSYGGGGGGATDIRVSPYATSNRVIVAGGGGGNGYYCGSGDNGGHGGNTTGQSGACCGTTNYYCYTGYGGSGSSGGAGACYGGSSGSLAQGGNGSQYGGGGGGGYYGGGGGYYGGGGGGSSYAGSGTSSVTHTQGFNTSGNGSIVLIPLGPTVTMTPNSFNFGPVTTGTPSVAQTFTISGVYLTTSPLTLTAGTGYEIYNGSSWVTSHTISFTPPTLAATAVQVRFAPSSASTFTTTINVTGGGLAGVNQVALTGVGAAVCGGIPTGGSTVATPTSATPTTPIVLSLSGSSMSGGLAYQWQMSTDNTIWTDISGATNFTATYSGIRFNTYFRCRITCPSYTATTSTATMVTHLLVPPSCIPSFTYTCPSYPMNMSIHTLVGFTGTLSDPSTSCSANYTDNTSFSTATLLQGHTYSITLSGPPSYWSNFSTQMWIDFDDDGTFVSSETIGGIAFNLPSSTPTTTVTIPSGATPGVHRLRIVGNYNSAGFSYPSIPPCPTSTNYGQGRDYKIVIIPPPPTISHGPTSMAFGPITNGTFSPVQVFTVSGQYLTAGPLTITPPAGYELSFSSGSGFTSSPLALSYTVPTLNTTPIYVRFAPPSTASYTGSVTVTGGGITVPRYVAVSGNGVPLCTGTPSTTTATALPTAGAPATVITLNLTGISAGGLQYQWQSSIYATAGYADIPGATNFSYTFSGLIAPTYYRCVLRCPAGGSNTPSNAVLVQTTMAPSSCVPTCQYTTNFCSNGAIANGSSYPLLLTGDNGTSISDVNNCINGTPYQDLTSTLGCTLSMGGSYVCSTGITSSYQSVQMWIDFNNDGIFVNSETVGGTNNFNGRAGSPITIPTGLNPGIYRMRVVETYHGNTTSANYPRYPAIPPCPTSTVYYCEARDYKITLQYTPCSGTPTTGLVSTDVSVGCSSFTSNMLLTSVPLVSGVTYNWQMSTTSATAGFSNISGATLPFYTAPVTSTAWYRQRATCSYSTLSGNSAVLALVVNPLPATITGPSNICLANPTPLSSATTGGTWSSSNPAVATAAIGSGMITGVAPGSTTITYALPTGCYTTTNINIIPSPASITGIPNVCSSGGTTTLADATAGGTWSSADATLASVDMSTGIVEGVNPGLTYITYTAPNTCTAVTPMTVNVLPPAISGTTDVCVGSATALYNSVPGGVWTSSSDYFATIGSATGIVRGEASGTPNMTYTLPTGCRAIATVIVNALPAPISGSDHVCVGSSVSLTNIGGGTWASSNTSLATVDATSGMVTGVNGGSVDITYTLPTGCAITQAQTVDNLPAIHALSGGGNYCPSGSGVHIGLTGSNTGVVYQLAEATTGIVGAPVAGTAAALDFGIFTTVGTYTVQATNSSTGCSVAMAGSANVGFSPVPTAYSVTGGGTYCAGGTGVPVGLAGTDLGVNYQLMYGTVAQGAPVVGTGSTISFGNATLAGNYRVVATDAGTTCTNTMNDSADVLVSPLPTVYNVSAGGSYCAGGTGVEITLDNSTPGINYQLFYGSTGSTVAFGAGSSISFGFHLGAGNYTVVATDITNGCTSNMNGTANIAINALPTAYAVTGGGNFCAGGTGVRIGTAYSVAGTNYRLRDASSTIVSTVTGSNSGLDFGLITVPGTYTVDAITTAGCLNNMTGSATITANPVPAAQTVSGGGGYCAGSTGSHVTLPASETGFNYQLYRGTTAVGAVVPGTGANIDFGAYTTVGTYSAKAISPTTGCGASMAGSVNVFSNPLPNLYVVTGGGNYCTGGTGVNIVCNNSQIGIDYELHNSITGLVTSISGSGISIDFGPQTGAGIYTVIAKNLATGCERTMNGSATVTILPLPAAHTVTGGGNYCTGGAGVAIGLGSSNTGIRYQLMDGTTAVGAPIWGTGTVMNFGMHTTTGTYTIAATNGATGCMSMMTGAANVGTNPLPTVYTVTGGGNYCTGGTGVTVNISNTEAGATYQLYRGTTAVGTPVVGTGLAASFGTFTTPGVYSAKATSSLGCASSMSATATVGTIALPTAYSVIGGGNYCAGGTGVPVGMSNTATGVNYQLMLAGSPVGTPVTGTGGAINFGLQTATGSYTVDAVDPLTTCANSMTGAAAIGTNPLVTPGVTLAAGAGVLCATAPITLTATPVNGGSAPVYEWKVGGTTVAGVTGNVYTYVPTSGDEVTAVLTSNAACTSVATAEETYTVTVAPSVMPRVVIGVTPSSLVCAGTTVTYNADTVLNGGSAPVYSWYKNGINVASGSSYATVAGDGDVVFALMTSNADCRTASTVFSNNKEVAIDSPALPQFALTAYPGTSIISGQSVTFRAVDVIAGTGATYQWKFNGATVASATGATYTPSAALANNDQITCTVSSNNSCGSRSTTHSMYMTVSTVGVQDVSVAANVKVVPNPNKGMFTIKGSMDASVASVDVEITNMVGQTVYSSTAKLNNGQINELVQLNSSLPAGMYILNLHSAAGNTVFHFVID